MKPGWHVYWRNPGEAGLPTEVRITAPAGFEVGELVWPIPKRFSQPGDILGYGYEGTVLLSTVIQAPASLRPGDRVAISADARWLCCEKVCIPGKSTMSLDLPVQASVEREGAALFDTWAKRAPVEAGAAGAPAKVVTRGRQESSAATGEVLSIDLSWASPVSDVDWFPVPGESLEVDEVNVSHTSDRSKISFRVTEFVGVGTPPESFESLVVFADAAGSQRGLRVRVPLRRG
jgi:thiol:disulfide interchange protein DsbD